MKRSLLDIIISISDPLVSAVSDKGLSSGHNGPYHDPETPVRNTGHWLITFSRAFEWTGDEKFRDAARRCADYLLSKPARPHGLSFHHRNGHKDHCNGLIGQAWTFEALAEATRLFDDPKYARLAEEVFFQHPFDEESGLWNRLEINGDVLPFDSSFNHQLWFSACAAMIEAARRGEIMRRVKRFMDRLDNNLTVLPNGLVYHPIEHLFEKELARQFFIGNRVKEQVKNLLRGLNHFQFPEMLESKKVIRKRFRENQTCKSLGYHAFSMYAFALLKPHTENHAFWTSGKFGQMIAYMRTGDFRKGLDDNKYGYPYNPPGFEISYSQIILESLGDANAIETTREWAAEQFYRCYNHQTLRMDRNTEDPVTHTARLYELARIPKEILEAVVIDSASEKT